jgi:ATF/CREB family transcription factor
MTEDIDDDVDEEEDSVSLMGEDIPDNSASTGRRGNKKPETEEEKRKNFLERNRQGEVPFF